MHQKRVSGVANMRLAWQRSIVTAGRETGFNKEEANNSEEKQRQSRHRKMKMNGMTETLCPSEEHSERASDQFLEHHKQGIREKQCTTDVCAHEAR